MIRFGSIIGLALTLSFAVVPVASAQEARFEDEAKRAAEMRGNTFPALMEEAMKVLESVESTVRGQEAKSDEADIATLQKKLETFTFRQNPDDLDKDQIETLGLAKEVLRDVKNLLGKQLATKVTLDSEGTVEDNVVYNLILRRATLESQLASIRLKGLHYSHPAHGLNTAIKAGYRAITFAATALEGIDPPKHLRRYVARGEEINEAVLASRFALARWRFRAQDKKGDETKDLMKLADSYEGSLKVEEKVSALLEDEEEIGDLALLLDNLLALEGERIEARDARFDVVLEN